MKITFGTELDWPSWARGLHSVAAGLGAMEATSSSRTNDGVVAWAVCVRPASPADGTRGLADLDGSGDLEGDDDEDDEHDADDADDADAADDDGRLVLAVSRARPDAPIAMRTAAQPLHAMALARSLVHRSARRLTPGALVSTHVGDVRQHPLDKTPPQYLLVAGESAGLPAGTLVAVPATWADVALGKRAREEALSGRDPRALPAGALTPLADAIRGITRALRKGKEPLFSSAAWTLEALLEAQGDHVRSALQELVFDEELGGERLDVVLRLADQANARALSRRSPGTPVVLFRMPLVDGGRLRFVPAYFHRADPSRPVRLAERHPESSLAPDTVTAGFDMLTALLPRNRGNIFEALGAAGEPSREFVLRRGFHADASFADVQASFVADGYIPVDLVMEP
jgi:hypothetical protein